MKNIMIQLKFKKKNNLHSNKLIKIIQIDAPMMKKNPQYHVLSL